MIKKNQFIPESISIFANLSDTEKNKIRFYENLLEKEF